MRMGIENENDISIMKKGEAVLMDCCWGGGGCGILEGKTNEVGI